MTLLVLFLIAPVVSAQATPVLTEQVQIGLPERLWVDGYGRALALSRSTAVVGAPLDGSAGTVTVYRYGQGGWDEEARLVPEGGGDGERFGSAVALSGDTAVVGAPHADDKAGAVYVFEREGARWTQVARLVEAAWSHGPGGPGSLLGASVAIDGDVCVAGAPGSGWAYTYERGADGWVAGHGLSAERSDGERERPMSNGFDDGFGASVAIWNDTLAVGARRADVFGPASGSVTLFTRAGDGWELETTLTADDGEAGDRFGSAVALCGDLLAVGAPGGGDAGPDAGAAYVFERGTDLDRDRGSERDPDRDPDLDRNRWVEVAKLLASDAAPGDRFGNVALLGTALAIGAPGRDANGRDTGAAYVFGRDKHGWHERARLAASDASPRDAFGSSVALSGFTVAVGAPAEDALRRRFPAYLYDLSGRFLSGAARSTVAEVVREVVTDGSWEVVRQHPRFAPEVGVMAPVIEGAVDGSDLPSLIMPPPCEVRFTVRPEDGPVVLRAAAGVDNTFHPRRMEGLELVRLGYEILVDDELVFEAVIEPLFKGDVDNRRWRRLVDLQERFDGLALGGLPLRPGDVVTLRTTIVHPEVPGDMALADLPRIPSGFGEVELVRRGEREHERATPERPNVVMIVMDTLRADRVGCYADNAPPTPALDALAARGVLFENAFTASSWTWPSTASLLTGLWPEEHGVVSDESCYLAAELETLPEVLAQRGYATGAFSCNPLIVPDKNFDQGFQYFDRPLGRGFRNTHEVQADVQAWIGAHAETRFFLYLHLADTHYPYEPTPEALALVPGEAPADYPETGLVAYHRELLKNAGRAPDGTLDLDAVVPPEHQAWMRRAYDQGVTSADRYVGDIVRWIETLGLDERTVIAFTNDHGEELLDRGLATHGQSLHPELVRAPLILAGPGIPEGARVERPVSNRHLAPTLARIGAGRMANVADPVDLLQLERLPVRTLFLSTEHGYWNGRSVVPIHGLRTGRWSLHHAPTGLPWGADETDPELERGELRLYDLAADPGERVDVGAEHPEIVRALFAELERHLAGAEASAVASPVQAGDATLQMLRDIGYIGDDEE